MNFHQMSLQYQIHSDIIYSFVELINQSKGKVFLNEDASSETPQVIRFFYQMRTHYRGQMYSEKRHGLGVLKYTDGSMYEGEWEDDEVRDS